MRMHASSFYPAITTHVQDAVDKHGEFNCLEQFLGELNHRLAKIQTAMQQAAHPPADADVAYRIHQAAAVCLKVLTGFSMAPRYARPPAALSHRTADATHDSTQENPAA